MINAYNNMKEKYNRVYIWIQYIKSIFFYILNKN